MGDAFGAPYEGGPLEQLLWRAIGKTKDGKLRYTDDTQMTIDLAESYLYNDTIDQNHLAQTFAQSYRWSRGYGPSTSQLLRLIKKGKNWREANKKKFKTGSFGNGAAMRAPILAMCFPYNVQTLLNSVIKSAEITHAHPLGIEGAKLIARATQAAFQDIELHVNQIKRYEAGTAQPTLETLVRLAKELNTTLDDLVFGEDHRSPDDELKLQFEALSQFDESERMVAKELLESLILKHNAKRAFADKLA